MRKFSALIVLISTLAFAEGTRTWEQSRFEDFEKGTANGVAIRSDGTLELAPSFKAIYTTPSTYIWSIAANSAGDVYAATGAPARVYRLTPDGQASIIFAPQELQVQALAIDKNGDIYAATSPDGKVYKLQQRKADKKSKRKNEQDKEETAPEVKARPVDKSQVAIDQSWTSTLFFDPGTKYIWDVALDREGNLFVATGDHGEIFKVTPTGEHTLFFKSDEAHIRVLAFDTLGNLIAGSDGSGLVYRISPAGEAFVLYSAPKKEITALAIDPAGNIYAAGVGEKRALPPPPPPTQNAPANTQGPGGSNPQPLPAIAAGGSEVYRIAPDGSPRRLWSSRDDLVYALGFDQAGRLLAGTGNKGRIFAIAGEDAFTDLLKASATQVTAFARSPRGGLYAATSNLGKVFLLGPAPDNEGSFESDVFDAHIFSKWGRAEVRSTGAIDLFARSGNVDNPDRNWSPWRPVDLQKDTPVDAPPARFIQWKAVLKSGNPPAQLDSVLLNYRSKNVAPDIDEVQVLPGIRYQSTPKTGGDNTPGGGIGSNPQAPPGIRDHESIGVRWNAHDDNDDQLVFSVYYRGDNDKRWLLLKDNLTDRFYSFDAGLLPDGGYVIKVVASDAPSHSPDEALTAEKQSPRFEVDTTPPRIDYLNAGYDAGQLHITFRAVDGFSPIKRAEYSVDAGDWQFIEPVDQISDSKVENYDVTMRLGGAPAPDNLVATSADATGKKEKRRKAANSANSGSSVAGDPPLALSGEHVIVVRVYDRFDNMGTAKAVVRGQ